MKYLFFILLFLFSAISNSFSQKLLISNKQNVKQPLNDPKMLDSLYPNAFHMDSTVYSVFPDKAEEVGKAWIAFQNEIGKYLTNNNFKWEKPTRSFCKAYFRKDGSVDYVIYNFKEMEKHEEFNKLVEEFIKTYKFPMSSNESDFSQCGVVLFKDGNNKE